MVKKSQFLYQFRAYFVNSNSIPIPFFSIPSPIPGIESGIEFNSHSNWPQLCWWHRFLILCLYNQSKSTYISDAHLLIKSFLNYVWTIWTYITYIRTNTMWEKIIYMDIISPPWWICPLHCQFPLFFVFTIILIFSYAARYTLAYNFWVKIDS